MIKISKMADYAVVILATLARGDDALMSAVGVAVKTGLPEPTVAKVLKLLSRENFITSTRGINGGYRLSLAPHEISVARIITAVDGPIALTSCADGSAGVCDFESRCSVRGRWNGVNYVIRSALEGVTLADMMNFESHAVPRTEMPQEVKI